MKGMMTAAALCALAVAVIPATGANAKGGSAAHGAANVTSATQFVKKAAASDMYEMESSAIALRKARSANVRAFAEMMVRDHRQTTQSVAAAAQKAGVQAGSPMLEAPQRQMIAQLEAAPAASFDRLYVAQQLKAHNMALALHEGYAATGDNAALRTVATSAIPIVRGHLAQLEKMDPKP